MPNYRRSSETPEDDLEIATRVLDTVQRQVASYQMSLSKLRGLRREMTVDKSLNSRISAGPSQMVELLVERGIPEALAVGMAAEDFQDDTFGGALALWTWDCCCTGCCVTCVCTGNTVA